MSGLFQALNAIHLCIVNDAPQGHVLPSTVFFDTKLQIRKVGHSSAQERPTLQFLHSLASKAAADTKFLYLHTKGVHWFGSHLDAVTEEWLRYMLYYNVTKWKTAIDILDSYDVYGCNYSDMSTPVLKNDERHYVGNFWWATAKHLGSLDPNIQGDRYQNERWVLKPTATRFFVASTVEVFCESRLPQDHESIDRKGISVTPDRIVIVSGMSPPKHYSMQGRKTMEAYAKRHGYQFFYSDEEPTGEDKTKSAVMYRKTWIVQRAAEVFPDAIWFVWLDSDMYVKNADISLHSLLPLTVDNRILYHVTHERPHGIDLINAGFKCVHRDALPYEQQQWTVRNTAPWNEAFYDQKALARLIFPQLAGRFWVHEWSKLNCMIFNAERSNRKDLIDSALFVHMCGMSSDDRNAWIDAHVTATPYVKDTSQSSLSPVPKNKMDLQTLVHKIGHTDKDTTHSYIPTYETKFASRRDAKCIMEIGVYNGGSIKLWESFFTNARVYGLDITMNANKLTFSDRVQLLQGDAYSSSLVHQVPNEIDIAIDDGPHTLESMKSFLQQYLPKLARNGILIIEDVQNITWMEQLREVVPECFKKHIEIVDLRNIKGRYDDLLFIVDFANSA